MNLEAYEKECTHSAEEHKEGDQAEHVALNDVEEDEEHTKEAEGEESAQKEPSIVPWACHVLPIRVYSEGSCRLNHALSHAHVMCYP